ncbi:MAG: galactokinase [Gammaproteobacteria bacterium]|nr:galactokinase [Gammaproteobacteria bacterium]
MTELSAWLAEHRSGGRLFFGPGRVNLIGDHTDYNGGLVMPFAVDMGVYLSSAAASSWQFHSAGYPDVAYRSGDSIQGLPDWARYVAGVISLAEARFGPLPPQKLSFFSNLPTGAGLSSSAALQMAVLSCLLEMNQLDMSVADKARLGKQVENDIIGVPSGIMDQFISAGGVVGSALQLDCATLEYQAVALAHADYQLLVVDSAQPRTLAASGYRDRVAECASALAALQQIKPASHLVAYQLSDLDAAQLTDSQYKRAKHVIVENGLVDATAAALAADDWLAAGECLNQSHRSLRDDYQSSHLRVDELLAICAQQPGFVGGRITGGGFGGCTVQMVKANALETFIASVSEQYRSQTGLEAHFYPVSASAGARELSQ